MSASQVLVDEPVPGHGDILHQLDRTSLVLYTPDTSPPSPCPSSPTTSSSCFSFDSWRNRSEERSTPVSSVFNLSLDLTCPTPKTRKEIDPNTGEVTVVPATYRNPYTGEWEPARCNNNGCPACGIINARRTAGAIALASPTYVFTLTGVEGQYEVIKKSMATFFVVLRRSVPSVAYVWTAEPNPSGTGAHVHAYLHTGSTNAAIRHSAIAHAREKAGFEWRFDLAVAPSPMTATYAGYLMKNLTVPDSRQEFLDLNGPASSHKLVHASRGDYGFWRDGSGGAQLTKKQAEAIALKRRWARRQAA